MENNCKDCQNWLPIDVFKGICKIDKKLITQETASCEEFDRIPKCKFCIHFLPFEEFLGYCEDTVITHPDLIATNCEQFSWIHVK